MSRRRRDKQRQRQQEYRERLKKDRRPTRDDIARIALHWLIVETAKLAVKEKKPARMNKVEDVLLDGLAAQGFNPTASDEVLGALIDKYSMAAGFSVASFTFSKKRLLRYKC